MIFKDIFILVIPIVGISLLIDKCLEPGMLLGWYGDKIRKSQKAYSWISRMKDINNFYKLPKNYKNLKWIAWLLKPLGGCIYCYNVWVTAILYSIISYHKVNDVSMIKLLLIIGISHFVLWLAMLIKKGIESFS